MLGEYGATGRTLSTAETTVAMSEGKIRDLTAANLNCRDLCMSLIMLLNSTVCKSV